MNSKLNKRLNDLYRLASHAATPKAEKLLAQNYLDTLMAKHGIKSTSEFISDIDHENDVTDNNWIRFNVKVTPFSRNLAMIIGDYSEDTIIFIKNNCVMYKKESTDSFIRKILERYDYHIDQSKLNRPGTKDYSHGFVYGVMGYFNNKKASESIANNEDNSEKFIVAGRQLDKIIADSVTPVTADQTNMGKIKDQKLFLMGMKHGKEWSIEYLT